LINIAHPAENKKSHDFLDLDRKKWYCKMNIVQIYCYGGAWRMKLKLAAVLGLLAIACVTVSPAEACSRVLYHGPENTVLTGRTMDWMEDVKSGLWIFPRGMKRDGVFKDAPFEWTS